MWQISLLLSFNIQRMAINYISLHYLQKRASSIHLFSFLNKISQERDKAQKGVITFEQLVEIFRIYEVHHQ